MALTERSRHRQIPHRRPHVARRGFVLLAQINAAPSVTSAVDLALAELGGALDVELCAVLNLEPPHRSAASGAKRAPLLDHTSPLTASLLATRETLAVANVGLAAAGSAGTPCRQAVALLATPVLASGEPVALLSVESDRPRRWRAVETALLEAVAGALGRAFEREALRAQVRPRLDHANARYGATTALIASLDLPTTIRSVVEHSALMTGAATAELLLRSGDTAALQSVAQYSSLRSVASPEADAAPTVLELPLEHDGQCIGVLRLQHPVTGGHFAPPSVAALRQFVHFAATAIANAQQHSAVQEANRLKSEFIATVSHELRTPMGAIMGYAELLTSGSYGALPGAMRDPLQRLKANADALLLLINQMLDLSRIEAGRLELHAEPFQPADLLHAVVAQVVPPHTVELRHTLAPDVPRIVLGDVRRLRQMLDYLIAHALRHTERGAVTVGISVNAAQSSAALVITVGDTGAGIPPDKLPLIWQPFPQLGGETTATGGAGLDLALVARLAQLMNGSVAAASGLGAGTTFTLRLPLRLP